MATISSENSVPAYLAKYAANTGGLNADAHQLLQSDTLKRHPKMDLDKSDLLQLLGYLEGELQARDIAIAALKLEKTKMMLTQAKYGRSSAAAGDPISALQRDSDVACDKSFDEASVRAMYGDQLVQLERLITTQHACQQQMRDQLVAVEKQYHKTCAELDEMKQLHAREVDDMDKVMCLMAKDLDRLKQETEMERAKSKRLDSKMQSSSTKSAEQPDELPVYAKHKQVALMLIRERSRLVLKLLETRKHGAELERLLSEERARARSLDENLERQVAECEQLCSRLSSAESLNRSLQTEIDKLKSAAGAASSPRQPLSIDALSASISNSPNPYAHPSPHTTYISVQQAMPGSSGLDPRRSANAALNGSRRISPEASVSSSLEDVNGRRRSPALERDVAAARLRSVISTAMDTGSAPVDGTPTPLSAGGSWLSVTGTVPASSPLNANASVIIDRPSSSPRQSSSPLVGGGMPPPMSPLLSKLPVLQSTGGGSVGQPGDPYFVPRSLMLSTDGSSRGGGSPMLNTSSGETRTMRRLIPIATASVGGTTSPRLAPLASLMQANGAFPSSAVGQTGSGGGGYGQKMPSLLLGKPK